MDKILYKALPWAKSLLFLLSFLILAASPALAKELYSEWHYSGDSFLAAGEAITVTHYSFYDTTVILGVNERTYIIEKGECKSSATRDYCITDIFQDRENATEDDHVKFTSNEILAGIEVTIRDRGPSITITRDFSNTSILVGQEIRVSVVIKNNGSEGTDSLVYRETLPEGVIFTSSSSSASYTPHELTFEANIPASSQKSFSYSFKLQDYSDFSTFAIINYTYEGLQFGLKSSTTKITVKKPYELSITLSPSKLTLFEKADYAVKVTNKYTKEIDVNHLYIKVPSAISVLSTSGDLEKEGEVYYWSGSLPTGRYESFSFELKPVKSGKYNIELNLSVTAGDEGKFNENKSNLLTSEIKSLIPTLTLSQSSLSEGAIFRLSFGVENPNEGIILKNIKAWINSSFFQKDIASVDSLAPGKGITLYSDSNMIAPLVDSSKKFDITAYGTYETTLGEKFNFSKKQTLQVTPLSKAITISLKADKTKMNASQNLTVNVSIKNNNQEPVQVEVSDSYSEGATLMGGKISNTLSFTKAETKQAYAYILNIPEHYDKEELIITTTASIPSKNYTDTKTINISVNLTKPVVEDEISANDTVAPETPPKEEAKPEEKPGFFKRVIDAIRNFFKKMI